MINKCIVEIQCAFFNFVVENRKKFVIINER
jgi:hypothetical protein